MLNCDRWVAVLVSYFWCLHKHLLIKHASNAIIIIYFLVLRIDMGIYLESIQRSFIFDKNILSLWSLICQTRIAAELKAWLKMKLSKYCHKDYQMGFSWCFLASLPHSQHLYSHSPSQSSILHMQKVLSYLHFQLTFSYITFFFLIKGKRNNSFLPFSAPSFDSSDSCNFKWKTSTFKTLKCRTPQDVPSCLPCSWDMSHFGWKVTA